GSGPHAPGGEAGGLSDGNGLRFGRRCPVGGGRLQNLCREGEARGQSPHRTYRPSLSIAGFGRGAPAEGGVAGPPLLAWTAHAGSSPQGDSGPEGDRRTGNGGSADALSSGGAGVASGKRRAGGRAQRQPVGASQPDGRSEERRVGKECRPRWAQSQ